MGLQTVSGHLSHAYCRACDIFFLANWVCPRCRRITEIQNPPAGSPPPIPPRGKGRKWIARDGYETTR